MCQQDGGDRLGTQPAPRKFHEDCLARLVLSGIDEYHAPVSHRKDRDAREPVGDDTDHPELLAIHDRPSSQERRRQQPGDANDQDEHQEADRPHYALHEISDGSRGTVR